MELCVCVGVVKAREESFTAFLTLNIFVCVARMHMSLKERKIIGILLN